MTGVCSQSFKSVMSAARPRSINTTPWPVLALDPGGTTGYAVFKHGELVTAGQVPGTAAELEALIQQNNPKVVVAEEYRIYAWKAKEHSWSDVPTLRLIGALQYICERRNLPLYLQSARVAKGFADDKKLKNWGLWQTGFQHANDAIRHGVYWLLFNKSGGSSHGSTRSTRG